jgi:maltooligosyltrehalose synthase
MTYATALEHVFEPCVIDESEVALSASVARKILIDLGANENQVSRAWVENHYRLIVWKAACLYRRFPEYAEAWSPTWVMNQLRYR